MNSSKVFGNSLEVFDLQPVITQPQPVHLKLTVGSPNHSGRDDKVGLLQHVSCWLPALGKPSTSPSYSEPTSTMDLARAPLWPIIHLRFWFMGHPSDLDGSMLFPIWSCFIKL